jgi:hypothetical protein
MRLVPATLALMLAAGQSLAAVAPVPDTCTQAADRVAFDTEGLKSELMVTALTCGEKDKYNAFMRTYQPAVSAEEKDLGAYFKRAYGKRYTKAYDEYISNLANVQSEAGLKSGTAFCGEFRSMFDEVMSLHNADELADFAHSQAIVQPVAFTTCVAAPPKAVRSRHHVTHASHKKSA